jgi:hypothetical protein
MGAQNIKTGLGALSTTQNESSRAKHENWTRAPYVPQKSGPGAQNMNTGPGALCTVENGSGSAKYENWN